MSSSIPPGGLSGKGPEDPYEKYRVQKIEEDNIAKERERKSSNFSQSPSLFGLMAMVFKKCTEFFESLSSTGKNLSPEAAIREHLLLFRAALETLQKENCSEDLAFLNRLSDLWNLLLSDAMQLRRNTPQSIQLHDWIKKIQSYPPDQEYSLGYYLSDYAGQNWLPFPYLEMIKHLHEEYAQLSIWIHELSKIIVLLET